jgi:hypothetical protein
MEININLSEKKLLLKDGNNILLDTHIVQGCEDSQSPVGNFVAGTLFSKTAGANTNRIKINISR